MTTDATQQEEDVLTSLKVNPPMSTAAFVYAPPKTAKLLSLQPARPPLLAAGTAAPNFSVNDKDGRPLKLSDFRGKAVVLDFWATWCGPCRESLPHTNDLAKKYGEVVALAVNVFDGNKAFQAWLPKNQPQFDTLVFAIDPSSGGQDMLAKAYQVSAIPTLYVIDKGGKIVAGFVGYNDSSPDLENAIKAATAPSHQ